MENQVLLDFIFFLILLYLLPSLIVLLTWGKYVFRTIMINIFFGWSIIGWFLALALSLKGEDNERIIIKNINHTNDNNNSKNDLNEIKESMKRIEEENKKLRKEIEIEKYKPKY